MYRIIVGSSVSNSAKKFGDLYDRGDYHNYTHTYNAIHVILDKYGSQDDLVTDVFDRASPDDQRKLMNLVYAVNDRDNL